MSNKRETPTDSFMPSGEFDTRTRDAAIITMIDFCATEMKAHDRISVGDCVKPTDPTLIRWVHLTGLQDGQSVEQIGRQFGIHGLLVEDILNTTHRPKLDTESDQFCLILRDLRLNSLSQIESEQVSIIVGSDFILSFQESNKDIFGQIRARLSNPKSRIRNSKSDFLGYSLIDVLVDRYLIVMDELADQVQALEDTLESLDKMRLNAIYKLRHLMGIIQRNVRPLQEAVARLIRDESGVVAETSLPYLRDLYDHLLHAGGMAETYKETLSLMLEVHLLRIDTKTNETVKVLTVVSTILLPLTFIASFFGMNFQNMPFDSEYGYPLVVLATALIGIALLLYFHQKHWI